MGADDYDYYAQSRVGSTRRDLLGVYEHRDVQIRVHYANAMNLKCGRIDGVKGGPTTMLVRTLEDRWTRRGG